MLLFTAAVCVFCAVADKAPSWLDTEPPRVSIEPVTRWHRSLFHVSLASDGAARLWIARENRMKMRQYRQPIPVVREGTYRFYYYAEDDFGNATPVDSITYTLDSRAPELKVDPPPGTYRKNVVIKLHTNEPCRLYLLDKLDDPSGKPIRDTVILDRPLEGFFAAVDSAGNRTVSEKTIYSIDASEPFASVAPPGGIYSVFQTVTIVTAAENRVFYSFDPLAPPEWFTPYDEPLHLPHGLTILRYFTRSPSGTVSEIGRASYVIDTIPPRMQISVAESEITDTIRFISKESARIRYTFDGTVPTESSELYTKPLVIERKGISRIKAKGWDRAGNGSKILEWEYKYDHTPPVVTANPRGGAYRMPVTVELGANEPARILYSLDGDTVDGTALVYSPGGVVISRQGPTLLRFRGIDDAENASEERSEWFIIDSRPPEIKPRVESDIAANRFEVTLLCSEKIAIHYTVNGADPTTMSPRYSQTLFLKSGDVLKYFGIDSLGNTTPVITFDELEKPIVQVKPPAGIYNRRLRLGFEKTADGEVWWRLLPDTTFRVLRDTVFLDREGTHSLEYFIQTSEGDQSAIRRNEYFIDWSPPQVEIRVQKGEADSGVVFFNASENASIYYTVDGSNPLFSETVRTAGNRFQRAEDRILLVRDPAARLAYYAEDAAGNQSALAILDVFSPRVVPNVPAGTGRLHDRILSIALQSQEGSIIHYERHGRQPTLQSPVYREPLTVSSSDTLVAFVVDASGYRGEAESFIYLIDLPPSPQFTTAPDTAFPSTAIVFDASGTIDRESPPERLRYRWDFDGDGVFETDSGFFPSVSHAFVKPGVYSAVLQVFDGQNRQAVYRKEVSVRERCPADMVPAFDVGGKAFCMDRYEWPNREGAEPLSNVSWVEAKMHCIDAGKRLCRTDEWTGVCRDHARTLYPYGDRYDSGRCATEEDGVVPSGSKKRCSSNGVFDMLGNAWEWIEEKRGDYVIALGGSFRYGKDAHCDLVLEGTVATRSGETGFRCCK